jgi:hypothetical protein
MVAVVTEPVAVAAAAGQGLASPLIRAVAVAVAADTTTTTTAVTVIVGVSDHHFSTLPAHEDEALRRAHGANGGQGRLVALIFSVGSLVFISVSLSLLSSATTTTFTLLLTAAW